MLILTAPAGAKVAARRRHSLRRRLQHVDQARPAKPLFDLGQFHFHRFTGRHKRHKHHHPPDPFPAKPNILDGQARPVAHGGNGRVHNGLGLGRQPRRLFPRQNGLDLFDCAGGGQAIFLAQMLDGRGMFDELVGPADAHHGRANAFVTQ